MSALLKSFIASSIEDEIQMHPAWLGNVSGLKAEKMLRGRYKPFLYILRAGEQARDYYVTFVATDYTIRHQPFVITAAPEGWYIENGGGTGPHTHANIDDVIHSVMHCNVGECMPFIQ